MLFTNSNHILFSKSFQRSAQLSVSLSDLATSTLAQSQKSSFITHFDSTSVHLSSSYLFKVYLQTKNIAKYLFGAVNDRMRSVYLILRYTSVLDVIYKGSNIPIIGSHIALIIAGPSLSNLLMWGNLFLTRFYLDYGWTELWTTRIYASSTSSVL